MLLWILAMVNATTLFLQRKCGVLWPVLVNFIRKISYARKWKNAFALRVTLCFFSLWATLVGITVFGCWPWELSECRQELWYACVDFVLCSQHLRAQDTGVSDCRSSVDAVAGSFELQKCCARSAQNNLKHAGSARLSCVCWSWVCAFVANRRCIGNSADFEALDVVLTRTNFFILFKRQHLWFTYDKRWYYL